MLIRITDAGLQFLKFCTENIVGKRVRRFYVGANDDTPIILVCYNAEPLVYQVWCADSSNEVGFNGFCRDAHKGVRVGKLTLNYIVPDGELKTNTRVVLLENQIKYLMERYKINV